MFRGGGISDFLNYVEELEKEVEKLRKRQMVFKIG